MGFGRIFLRRDGEVSAVEHQRELLPSEGIHIDPFSRASEVKPYGSGHARTVKFRFEILICGSYQ